MYQCLQPGNVGVRLPWEQCLPLAREAGFEGVDLEIDPKLGAAYYLEKLARFHLKPGGTALPVDFRAAQATYETQKAGFPSLVRTAAAVGLKRFYIWIWPFSDDLKPAANWRFHIERLRPLTRVLADHGCRLGLEFIGPRSVREGHKYPFARALDRMIELAGDIGDNVGLLLDSWHWHTSLGTPEDIRLLANQQVVYVHVNDCPAGVPMEQYQDLVRRMPGQTGVQDIGAFMHALRHIGYDGPVVAEPFMPELQQLPPEEALRRTKLALDTIWSAKPKPVLPQTMKAVATGGRKAWLVDLPVPRPQGNQVVVRLHASPICGSNLGAFIQEGQYINDGHEGAGQVVAVAHSTRLKVGDRVALAPLNGCGRCEACQRGDIIYCADRPAVHGNFAQYTMIADHLCVALPDDIDYVTGSLLGCGLGPAYEAMKQLAVRAFDTVMITGLGPVGLGATALATFLGARVIAMDPEEYRRGLARELGAELVLSSADPQVSATIGDFTAGRGIPKAVDCSGRSEALRFLIDHAAVRGRIAIIGENHGNFELHPSQDMIRKGLGLIGCWHMNINDAPDLIEFLRRAAHKAQKLISHRFGFGQLQQAFETFASRHIAKVVLLPQE